MRAYSRPIPGADVRIGWFTAVSWTTVGAGIFTLCVLGVHFAPSGSSVALWWPGAGLSVWFALVNPRERRLAVFALVLLSSGLANAAAGRSFWMALGFGVANASEAWVVAALLNTGTRRFQLDSAVAGLRFLLSVAVGALVIGVIGGGVVAGAGGDFMTAAVGVAVSHASTVILIASFAVLPPRLAGSASWPEIVVQTVALLVVAYLAFRPGTHLPLAFTPYPLLAWAAFRAPIRVVLAEVLAVSSIAVVFTLGGWGPFGAATLTIGQTFGLLELFLVSLASIGIILGAAQYEMRAVSRAMAETTQMLSSGVVEAQVGMLIVGPVAQGRLVLWRNPAAVLLLEDELTGDLWEGPVADAADEARESGQQVDVRVGAGRVVSVTAHTLLDDAGRRQLRFAVQMVDVTESLRAVEMQLAAAYEKAEALTTRADLERQRDDFVATTSHELRTPVTSIVGYAELLAEGESLGAMEQKWVEIISRNAHRLSELVEDLLTLGRAAQGHPSRLAQTVPLAALVCEAVAAAGVLADQRRIRVTVVHDDPGATVHALPSDVSRTLTNLISNALKFTGEGGHVTVTSRVDGPVTELVVHDSGPGMTPAALSHAFERFYRAPEAERDNIPGTGLGLPIVAELVARNDGTIELTCPPAGGLAACVRLPNRPAPADAVEVEPGVEPGVQPGVEPGVQQVPVTA